MLVNLEPKVFRLRHFPEEAHDPRVHVEHGHPFGKAGKGGGKGNEVVIAKDEDLFPREIPAGKKEGNAGHGGLLRHVALIEFLRGLRPILRKTTEFSKESPKRRKLQAAAAAMGTTKLQEWGDPQPLRFLFPLFRDHHPLIYERHPALLRKALEGLTGGEDRDSREVHDPPDIPGGQGRGEHPPHVPLHHGDPLLFLDPLGDLFERHFHLRPTTKSSSLGKVERTKAPSSPTTTRSSMRIPNRPGK